MPPVPPWRFAPFRAPAAIDMNLCTDSVLPGSIRPVPVALRLGFVATSLLHSWNLSFWNVGWGRSPPLLRSAIFNPDRPDCLPRRLCPPIEGSISCKRLGIPPPKAPAITAEDPFHPPVCGGSPGILQKDCLPRASLVVKAWRGRSEKLPWFQSFRALYESS
jgi:hypothetical protein